MDIGSIIKSNKYGMFEIIKFKENSRVTVKFIDTGFTTDVLKGNAKKGAVRDPYARNCYGVGYIGEGINNFRSLRSYSTWRHMIERCYGKTAHLKFPSYNGCSVCTDWQCYKMFKLWYDSQPYSEEGELDKDLLIKGNKCYSPAGCTFLPREVNNGLQGSRANSGSYPVGVYYKKANKNYIAQLALGDGVQKHLGSFATPTAAFEAYKVAKESQVRSFADKYYNRLSVEALTALRKWELT